jgi:hypothetical protein
MDLYKAAESGPPSEFEAFSETALTSTLKAASTKILSRSPYRKAIQK